MKFRYMRPIQSNKQERISQSFLLLNCRMIFTVLPFLLMFFGQPARANFRASVIKIDITPGTSKTLSGFAPRQSEGVHIPIYHRILVMDDGVMKFVLASSELEMISPSEYEEVAELLKNELGIQPENFWWTVTHTHSAPRFGVPGLAATFFPERYEDYPDNDYTGFVKENLLEGVRKAIKGLSPAKLTVGKSFSLANINRRAIGTDNKARIGRKPDGYSDHQIGLIRIDDMQNRPITLVVNYPVHGTVWGADNRKISGDLPGIISDYVERSIGAPVVFINGAAGNLAPIYSDEKYFYTSMDSEFDQLRVFLGAPILEAYKRLPGGSDSIVFQTRAAVIETPQKRGLKWPSYLNDYKRTTPNGTELIRLPVKFLRINKELVIWSLPVELFCEISNEIREKSPFPFTFYFGYANGWLGYLPTEKERQYGGYEIETASPFSPGIEKQIKEAVLGFLQGELAGGE